MSAHEKRSEDAVTAGKQARSDKRSLAARLERTRLLVDRAIRSSGVAPVDSIRATDALLLCALASEKLGLGASGGALDEAGEGAFERAISLCRGVRAATGLNVAHGLPDHTERPSQAAFSYAVFPELASDPDPFGTVAQWLRRKEISGEGAKTTLVPAASARDLGGYYTPFPLAKRLAVRAIGAFEEVPSVLDPACGAGTFLAASFDVVFEALDARRRKDPSLHVEPVSWAVAAMHGVEVDPTALLAARLSIAVRAVLADRRVRAETGQMALFGATPEWGPLISDRLRLGDALGKAPEASLAGTERLRLRLLARDTPGRLPSATNVDPITWDAAFPLRFADDEGTFKEQLGFDRIVTNPPFVPVDRIPEARRAELKHALATMQKRFDLFLGFVERSFTVLASGGVASLLVPRTLLTEANAEKLRTLLLERSHVRRIEELGPIPFDGARVECIAIEFEKRVPTDGMQTELVRRGPRGAGMSVEVPQSAFRKAPRHMMRFELAEPAAEDCVKLSKLSVPLGRYFCASWGARGTPVEKFHVDNADHPLSKPLAKGEDVSPFVVRHAPRWLIYDVEQLYRPSLPEFFEQPKLLVRKVTGARGLVCAVDESGLYTDDSLACVVRKSDLAQVPAATRKKHRIELYNFELEPSRAYDLHLVAALLQTPLVQTYYRVQLGGGLNVFPELIESLPLPKPEALQTPAAQELAELGRACARGAAFDMQVADRLARELFGLDDE